MRGPNGAVIIITANTDKPKIFTDSLMTIRKKKFLGLDEKLLSLLCDHVVCLKIFNAGTVQQSVDRVSDLSLINPSDQLTMRSAKWVTCGYRASRAPKDRK